jgi:hypothetical protein
MEKKKQKNKKCDKNIIPALIIFFFIFFFDQFLFEKKRIKLYKSRVWFYLEYICEGDGFEEMIRDVVNIYKRGVLWSVINNKFKSVHHGDDEPTGYPWAGW